MKNDIILATIAVFNEKGVKFTLDDIAKELSISKKSIYKYFNSKEEIINEVIDWLFDDIERQHYEILKRNDLSQTEKLRQILIVNPSMMEIDDDKMLKLKELYPKCHELILNHFKSRWDLTLSQLKVCIDNNEIKPIPNEIFRTILIGIFDSAIDSSDYAKTVEECVDWFFKGIVND